MALFDFLRKRDDSSTTTTTQTEPNTTPVSDVLLQALLNSEAITREQALTLPAVSGAVDFIANMIASMPVKLYKYKDGKVEEKEDDPRVRLLNGDTGDTLDAFQMKKAMVEDYLLGRGGYCYIRRYRNDVTGLFYVKDIYVDVIPNFKPIYKDYYILVMGEEHDKDDFVKLLRNTKDGGTGTGLTNEVSKALETAYNTLLYQLTMVKSGGNKKGFLKSEGRLDQDTINTLKLAWKNLYGNNTENVVVLNKGLEFQEASQSAVETQLNESKKTLQDEINNIFHIHPDDFYLTFKCAIYPIVKAFATALNRDLLLEKEKGKMFFDFDVKEIIKANVQERYQAYKIAKETGWMTFNEIRRMENMNYIEGMDTVNVGLGAVLYDTKTHKYYTPNTDTVGDLTDETPVDENGEPVETPTDEAIQHVITDKILDTEYEQEYQRFNPNHDSKTGRFGTGSGSSGGSSSSGSGESNGGSSSSSDRKELNKKINEVEQKRKNLDHEEATVFDKNGKIITEASGETHKVSIDDTDNLKGAILTHNHPSGGTFSTKDLESYVKYDLDEIRASTDKEYFSLRKGSQKVDTKIVEAFDKEKYNANSYASKQMMEKIKNKTLDYVPQTNQTKYMKDLAKEAANYYDNWFNENASKYGYIYERGDI